MATLKDLIERHLACQELSARAFAEQAGMGYGTLLSLLTKGNVPRKPEHREALRRALRIESQAWAEVLAASGKDAIELPSEGPLTLQQLVTKALYAQGFSEQTFAKASGIPYPTVLGITRKGAVPRTDTLHRLSGALGVEPEEVDAAAQRSRSSRRETDQAFAAPPTTEPVPDLATRVAAAARAREQSLASFASDHDLPYLSLMKLLGGAEVPEADELRGRLEEILAKDAPLERGALEPRARSALHQALLDFVRGRGLTIKAFADACGLSALTAARLIKHGALPGRASTHRKLQTMLGIDDAAYAALVDAHASAAPVVDARSETEPVADHGFEHSETEEITADQDHGDGSSALHPKAPREAPTVDELLGLIDRLSAAQREALRAFIRTMLA